MKSFIIFLLVCLAADVYSKDSPMTLADVKKNIYTVIQSTDGVVAVAFKDLRTGRKILINEQRSFHAASTMKVPVMIEVFRQVHHGKFSLEDSLPVVNSFESIIDHSIYSLDRASDNDDSLYQKLGGRESIGNLVARMITLSSNLGTNILIQKVTTSAIMKTMRSLGARNIHVLRGVEDSKAYAAGKNNTVTALDLLTLYEQLALMRVVSRTSSQAMVEILTHQRLNDMIPAKLPADLKIAHKTGFISGVQHDGGIIFLPDGRKYVLVVLTKDLKSQHQGIESIATISRIIYDYQIQ